MNPVRHLLQSITAHRTIVLHPQYEQLRPFMESLPQRFTDPQSRLVYKGRNELRLLSYQGLQLVVKSFHRPNFINRFVYGILRPSKAKRSYLNAIRYTQIGVGTPQPVGYLNLRRHMLFYRSYYVTLQSACTHTYNELFYQHFDYADEVVRQVGRVTAQLHNHGYAHKDYGRGNILFERDSNGHILIDIVDLNRMYIGPINMKQGCKNLERLPATPHMHRLIAEEYAKARGFDAEECYRLMQAYRSTQPGKIDGKY